MVLMTGRRIVLFISMLTVGRQISLDISESIAIAISCLMLMGIHLIRHYFLSINADDARRKLAEQELSLVTQRLELAARSSNLGVWDWDVTNNIMTWDDRMLALYGLTWETFPGGVEAWQNGLHPEDRDKTIEECQAALRGEKEWNTDFRVLHPNKTVRHIKANGAVIRDSAGTPVRMLGINYDITERKRMEEELLENEERFRTAFEFNTIGIAITSPEKGWIKVNDETCRMLGYTFGELTGMTWAEITHPDDLEADVTQFNLVFAGEIDGYKLDKRFIRKDGEVVYTMLWVNCKRRKGGKVDYFIAILQDMTERKKMEAALRQSEEKFQTLFESSIDALFILDINGNFIDVNKPAYERLGYTKEEMLSTHISQIELPEFAVMVHERMAHMQKHGEGMFESAHKRKDGSVMPVEINARTIDFEGKKVVFSVIRDITERKLMEEALRESEKRYHTLFEQSPDGILIINNAGKIIEFNETAHRQLGYSREEFAKLSLSDIDPVESQEEIQARIEKILEAGQAEFDVKHRTKQGEDRDVHIITKVIVLSGGPIFYAIWHDITERKKAEDRINQSLREKETLLRELYHRTKNNMQVITSLLNLQSRGIDDKKTLQILKDTENRIHSMALVHEKLYKTKNLSQVNLSDYVRDLANALMKSHNAGKEQISLMVDVERIPISIDTITPLGLVLNELMTNALKYAFPDNKKGEIIIRARLNEDEIIELTFGDNGIGIPQDIDLEETESLGLTIVRTLVESQIKGNLELRTQNGTVFIIKFKDKDHPARI
jgi:PAS domain S-box-containing protein